MRTDNMIFPSGITHIKALESDISQHLILFKALYHKKPQRHI